jgi:hypothetical protein
MMAKTQTELVTFNEAIKLEEIKRDPSFGEVSMRLGTAEGALKVIKNIRNSEDRDSASDAVIAAREAEKAWEDIRVEVVTPFNGLVKAINGLFNPRRQDVEAQRKRVNGLVSAYDLRLREEGMKEERQLRRLQEQSQRRMERAGAKPEDLPDFITQAPPPAETTRRTEASTGYQKETWDFEITDKMALIKAVAEGKEDISLLAVNESVIKTMVRQGGRREMPGVRIFRVASTTLRKR